MILQICKRQESRPTWHGVSSNSRSVPSRRVFSPPQTWRTLRQGWMTSTVAGSLLSVSVHPCLTRTKTAIDHEGQDLSVARCPCQGQCRKSVLSARMNRDLMVKFLVPSVMIGYRKGGTDEQMKRDEREDGVSTDSRLVLKASPAKAYVPLCAYDRRSSHNRNQSMAAVERCCTPAPSAAAATICALAHDVALRSRRC